jgi:sulfotransferase family protein
MHNIRETVERIRAFRAAILQNYLPTPLFQRSLRDVKRVVIINSASRSGSSLLYNLLCRLPQVYSLTGEAAPFYKLNTALDGFDFFASDKIPDPLIDRVIDYDGLARDFFSDLQGAGAEILTRDVDLDEYADHLLLRFALQWTEVDFDRQVLRTCIDQAFAAYAQKHPVFATEAFYLVLLARVTAAYPEINPFYYDISTEKVALQFPFTEIPTGPPNPLFNVEEPPFILQSPRRKATPADLSDRILLLKSTVDCYRMNLIDKIFPAADIRTIHLVRNPAATTNGIYDGWLHRGFFSHNMQPYLAGDGEVRELRIRGYSDLYPHGSSWWNFDLPEGWQEYADRELVEVCAFQWYSANAEILGYQAGAPRKTSLFHFEDIIRNLGSRTREFARMLDFMGIPPEHAELLPLDDLPVVQSTLPPQLYRWKKRQDIIARLLDDPKILAMSERLGYRKEGMAEWL